MEEGVCPCCGVKMYQEGIYYVCNCPDECDSGIEVLQGSEIDEILFDPYQSNNEEITDDFVYQVPASLQTNQVQVNWTQTFPNQVEHFTHLKQKYNIQNWPYSDPNSPLYAALCALDQGLDINIILCLSL